MQVSFHSFLRKLQHFDLIENSRLPTNIAQVAFDKYVIKGDIIPILLIILDEMFLVFKACKMLKIFKAIEVLFVLLKTNKKQNKNS